MVRIGEAPLRNDPFPHLYVDQVFPGEFHAALRAALPPDDAYGSLSDLGAVAPGRYPERGIIPLGGDSLDAVWQGLAGWLLGREFMDLMLRRFDRVIGARLRRRSGRATLLPEAFLVRDRRDYALGPHTDAPEKLLSGLFYIPADDRWRDSGTALYRPRDPGFTCAGGPHYGFEPFDRVATMPYLPNTFFAFPKSERSFHGVEALTAAGMARDVIIYDITLRPARCT